MNSLSVLVITLNEEANVGDCLKSIEEIASEIVVVDSGSTDGTVSIAEQMGAKVFVRQFDDYASQYNWGLQKCTNAWVLIIDADERVSLELLDSIKRLLDSGVDNNIGGFFIRRTNFFLGRPLKHAASDRQLRLIRASLRYETRIVHSEINRDSWEIGYIDEPLLHLNMPEVRDFATRILRYAPMEARTNWREGDKVASKVRFQRRLWGGKLGPFWRFVWVYFYKRGFLDGCRGFHYAMLWVAYGIVESACRWELSNTELRKDKDL